MEGKQRRRSRTLLKWSGGKQVCSFDVEYSMTESVMSRVYKSSEGLVLWNGDPSGIQHRFDFSSDDRASER